MYLQTECFDVNHSYVPPFSYALIYEMQNVVIPTVYDYHKFAVKINIMCLHKTQICEYLIHLVFIIYPNLWSIYTDSIFYLSELVKRLYI